ncbi:MAG TPA: radical SAM protein [Bacteroidales bacterium]|nr:radical SAM protein [Bacteroidales bacterium]
MKMTKNSTELSKEDFEKINKQYPIKISKYISEQIQRSEFIAKQFFPSLNELNQNITITEPFKGLLKTEIKTFERLYEDRVVLKLTSICPSHCRFCYRRGYVFGDEKMINKAELDKAINIIKADNSIRSVLLTGGFPIVLGVEKIKKVISEVIKIDHINQVYFALGRPIMEPSIISDDFVKMITGINNKLVNKNIACTVHINHPDELTKEVIAALKKLTLKGITIWNQSTLLKGVNDNEKTIAALSSALRSNGIIPYYLIHAMPMTGTAHFRTSVAKGIKLMRYMERFSGHERPIYIVIPAAGKVQLSGDSKLKYKTEDGKKYVVLTMPYKAKDFLKINNLTELPERHYVNSKGFVVAEYLDGED